LSDIFLNKKNKKYSKIPDEGSTPFVSSTSANNGVVGLVDIEPNQVNAITVSTNGACFDCFYHSYEFAASSDVEVLYPKFKMNKFNVIFIISILKKRKGVYSYGYKPKNGVV
jgi:hypothetical protein